MCAMFITFRRGFSSPVNHNHCCHSSLRKEFKPYLPFLQWWVWFVVGWRSLPWQESFMQNLWEHDAVHERGLLRAGHWDLVVRVGNSLHERERERGGEGSSQGKQAKRMSLFWPEVSQTLMCITLAPRKPNLKKHNLFMLAVCYYCI